MLRPQFTEMLAERLLHGANLNLSGAHGEGRRRTLEDLRSILPDSLQIHQYDFRRDRTDPLSWFEACDANSEQTLLILHNFNEMPPGVANRTFLDRVRERCKRSNISLLTITECEAQNLLGLESIQLPPLTEDCRTATDT